MKKEKLTKVIKEIIINSNEPLTAADISRKIPNRRELKKLKNPRCCGQIAKKLVKDDAIIVKKMVLPERGKVNVYKKRIEE